MILLVDYRPALRARTGVGEYVHELLAALQRHREPDDEVHLFTASLRDRLDPSVPRVLGGVRIHDLPIPVKLLHWAWNRHQWPPVDRLVRVTPDVVHAAHPLLIPARRAAQVITIHDLDFLDRPEGTRAEIRRDYARLVAAHAARADAVLTSSRHTADAVRDRLGVSEERITTCPAGTPAWAKEGRTTERRPDGYILFVGTLAPRKNVGTLLDAYERLAARRPDVPPLRLAGAATPSAGPWLDRLARPPLHGRARHVGYVADADRRALFEGASVLVIPSWHEGFGLPALEAMALGVPVVASDRGALPEVIGDAGLLVDPADADALADAIDRVLTDAALARACIQAGRARTAAWSWDQAAERVRGMYEAASGRRRRR